MQATWELPKPKSDLLSINAVVQTTGSFLHVRSLLVAVDRRRVLPHTAARVDDPRAARRCRPRRPGALVRRLRCPRCRRQRVPAITAAGPATAAGRSRCATRSLTQINRSNVAQLEVAWTYDTGETGGLQTQPIVVDGVLYGYTPTHKTFALRAATGEHLWTFDPGSSGAVRTAALMYWASGRRPTRLRRQSTRFVYALDAATGKPIATFGDDGRIDLRQDLGRDPEKQSVRLTSPGVVYKDLFIVGGRVSEGLPASPGDIRAYDVRTGTLRWAFHTIPHPGESGYETWPKDAWTVNGGANNWTGMALDEARGIVYVPTGSAAADFYGANRLGDNLFANCLHRARRPTPASASGTSRASATTSGIATFRRRPRSPRLQRDGRTIDAVAADHQAGLRLRVRSRERHAAVPDRIPSFSKERSARRNDERNAADPDDARAVRAAAADARHADHADAGSAPVGGRSVCARFAATVRSSRSRRAAIRSSFPASTAAPSGAAPRSIRRPACST